MKNHNLYKSNPGLSTNKSDFSPIHLGKEANSSFVIGRSSFPVFFTADGHNVHLQDCARGGSVMVMFKNSENYDFNIIKWDVDVNNNSMFYTSFKNDFSNINDSRFKILPMAASHLKHDNKFLCHAPFCFYFRRNNSFNINNFYLEETVWNNGHECSSGASMTKLAYVCGFRTIFLNNPKIDESSVKYYKMLIEKSVELKFELIIKSSILNTHSEEYILEKFKSI